MSCNSTSHISKPSYQQYWNENWKFNDSKLENRQGYLKSNDIINISIEKSYGDNKVEFLRSHDIQFTIGNDTFQEVVCHNERLGGNDEVSKFNFYFIFIKIYNILTFISFFSGVLSLLNNIFGP